MAEHTKEMSMTAETSNAQGVVDEAAVKRAVAADMSAPPGISVDAYVRIVLEAALTGERNG